MRAPAKVRFCGLEELTMTLWSARSADRGGGGAAARRASCYIAQGPGGERIGCRMSQSPIICCRMRTEEVTQAGDLGSRRCLRTAEAELRPMARPPEAERLGASSPSQDAGKAQSGVRLPFSTMTLLKRERPAQAWLRSPSRPRLRPPSRWPPAFLHRHPDGHIRRARSGQRGSHYHLGAARQ